jgi:hypothetical protein
MGRHGTDIRAALVVLMSIVGVEGARAQEAPLVVEAMGGVAIPVGTFEHGTRPAEGAAPGASFGVDFALAGGGRWTPYIGFNQHRFGCEDAGCGSGGRYVATGFRTGLRLIPFPGRSVLPWLSMGVITTHVEAGDLGPANAGPSDLAVGGEIGVGVHIGARSQVAVAPAVRMTAVNPGLPDGTLLRMRYLVADVALVLSF